MMAIKDDSVSSGGSVRTLGTKSVAVSTAIKSSSLASPSVTYVQPVIQPSTPVVYKPPVSVSPVQAPAAFAAPPSAVFFGAPANTNLVSPAEVLRVAKPAEPVVSITTNIIEKKADAAQAVAVAKMIQNPPAPLDRYFIDPKTGQGTLNPKYLGTQYDPAIENVARQVMQAVFATPVHAQPEATAENVLAVYGVEGALVYKNHLAKYPGDIEGAKHAVSVSQAQQRQAAVTSGSLAAAVVNPTGNVAAMAVQVGNAAGINQTGIFPGVVSKEQAGNVQPNKPVATTLQAGAFTGGNAMLVLGGLGLLLGLKMFKII